VKCLHMISLVLRGGLSVSVFLMSLAAKAQVFQENGKSLISTATQRDLKTIRVTAQGSEYFYEQIRVLCNEVGPRLSGSPQAAAAVNYVAKQMRDLGLEVRLEPVTVRHWVRGREEAELVRYPGQVPGTSQKLVVAALGDSVRTPKDGITAHVLVVNTFEELDGLSPATVKGKIVLFNHAFDEFAALAGRAEEAYGRAVPYRTSGPARAAEKGAVAALVRSVGPRGLRLPHTGITKYNNEQKIPAGAITTEDADLIAALAERGEVAVHLVLTPSEFPPAQSYNVIADLKGSQRPEQIVVVSGHLDSWDLGTGALDDASGVAVAMDALRIIKAINPRPKRTVRFIAWMNEENGLAGGRAYAEDYKSELVNHLAAIELDYGDGRPLGLNVCANQSRLLPLAGVLHEIGDLIGRVYQVDESPGSDLEPMNQTGVPAIAPLQDSRHYFDYHHTAADTFDKVRIDELRRNVEAVSALAYALSQDSESGEVQPAGGD
jgi:carboxypeptidase Q